MTNTGRGTQSCTKLVRPESVLKLFEFCSFHLVVSNILFSYPLLEGHWLGLFHTFESGCDDGDGISDTPPEKYAYYGCNPASSRDTCGNNEPRPIHNYLNYADDPCMVSMLIQKKGVERTLSSTLYLSFFL